MKRSVLLLTAWVATFVVFSSVLAQGDAPTAPIPVGSQRQLFIDDFFFASQKKITLVRHDPRLEEVVIKRDKPWEYQTFHYTSVVRDADRLKMWYRVEDSDNDTVICYAESTDGIHWEKPNLGLIEWKGSRDTNIVIPSETVRRCNGVSVIIDPIAPADQRYKMITSHATPNLWAYVSADGLKWRATDPQGMFDPNRFWGFDSHNVLVWDDERRRYVVYCRGWMNRQGVMVTADMPEAKSLENIFRVIRRGESTDFRNWTDLETVVAPDEHDPSNFNLYTNATIKYARAQRAWFMFPMVLYEPGRQFPGAPNPGLSDVVFLTSRDGVHWDRRFRQPFLRAGPDQRNWVDRNPIMGIGAMCTSDTELSMYYSELLRSPQSRMKRATIRKDGFVSVRGPYTGWGEFTTHPLTFEGDQLEFNYRTSGGGTILVELQDADGKPLSGFNLDDCDPIFGDKIDGSVTWKDEAVISNRPIRLRVRLRDADLFAFRFK